VRRTTSSMAPRVSGGMRRLTGPFGICPSLPCFV
jgi:hypothetical protein